MEITDLWNYFEKIDIFILKGNCKNINTKKDLE